jgi:hypothetical protein
MSPGRKVSSTRGAVPFGLSFAIADLIVMLLEREAHPAGTRLGILVQLFACRPAIQSATARTSNTAMKILRNVYMTRLALVPIKFKANNGLHDLDLDQTMSPEQKERDRPSLPVPSLICLLLAFGNNRRRRGLALADVGLRRGRDGRESHRRCRQ